MNGVGDLVRADTDEVEVLKAFLSSVFPKKAPRTLCLENGSRRSYLTNQIAFDDKRTGSVKGGRSADVTHLDFSKTFYSISHSTCASKLGHYNLGAWITRWV